MHHDESNLGSDQLLHCTLERTVVRTRNPDTGQPEVVKLLLRGSLNDAERELQLGRAANDEGVVRYHAATIDAQTGRPCLRTEYVAGADLEALVARRGAFDAATACLMLAPVAECLARMHALRSHALVHGLCHGDVKPSNLLRTDSSTLILDFEHAGPIASGRCAGTVGFAGPEAGVGAPLNPAFDVYGLGASLHWLLTGITPERGALAAQDLELQMLVAACTASSPAARPNASAVARRLRDLAQRLSHDPAEPARHALLAGELDACVELLQAPGIPEGTRATLAGLLAAKQRLLARVPHLAEAWVPVEDATDIKTTTQRLRQLEALLRRFPRHPGAVAARIRAMDHAGVLMHRSLPRLTEFVRAEDFAAGRALIAELEQLARAVIAAPGRMRVPGTHDPRMPTLIQRAPLSCLQQEALRVAAAASDSDRIAAAIEQAESRLALDEAEKILERLASHHGGTSAAVTRRRDRLHRLGFYVERISRAAGNLDRLRELLPNADLRPLFAFVGECSAAATRAHQSDDGAGGAMGMRQLQLALANLADEFGSLRARAMPAHDALRSGLETLSDEAWDLLADAQQKLLAEPVPVRPLQVLLGRLDTFRVLEALIDRPKGTRSQAVDRIEALRLRLEQALATRDRLARGAEQALARGHWTTGLFEMERAVTSVEGEDAAENQEAAKLRERLAQARRRKQEIEEAQRRNIDLENRYAAMQSDPQSRAADRLRVLRERRDCLQFLAVHSQQARGELYNRDLRGVELRITEEQAQQAVRMFDTSTDLDERLLLARQTLAQIDAFRQEGDPDVAPSEVLRALAEQWQHRLTATLAKIEERTASAAASQRRQQRTRRTFVGTGIAVVAALLLLFFRAGAVSAEESQLRNLDLTALQQVHTRNQYLDLLRRLAGDEPHAQRAVELLKSLRPDLDLTDWHHRLTDELAAATVPSGFGNQAWRIGIALALQNADPKGREALRQAVQQDRQRLEARGMALAKDAKFGLEAR